MKFILSSIRVKVTLAMLFVGLFSILSVGLISRGIMLDRFNTLVVEEASRSFISEARDYYNAYGSWERARNSEPFFNFVRRTRPELFTENAGPRPGPAPNRPAPAEPGPAGERLFRYGGQAPPFIVTDELGQVQLPLFEGYEAGDLVSQELLDRGIPIESDGSVIGIAIPEQRVEISELEARYLSVFNSSWLISLVLACIVALWLGWYFGRKLTQPIVKLKWSMDAIKQGELKQQLEVESIDELGRLTEIFNEMSHRLDKSYRELEASNRLLSQYSNWLAAEHKKTVLKGSSIDKDEDEGLL